MQHDMFEYQDIGFLFRFNTASDKAMHATVDNKYYEIGDICEFQYRKR